jgi:hypothetical protein
MEKWKPVGRSLARRPIIMRRDEEGQFQGWSDEEFKNWGLMTKDGESERGSYTLDEESEDTRQHRYIFDWL